MQTVAVLRMQTTAVLRYCISSLHKINHFLHPRKFFRNDSNNLVKNQPILMKSKTKNRQCYRRRKGNCGRCTWCLQKFAFLLLLYRNNSVKNHSILCLGSCCPQEVKYDCSTLLYLPKQKSLCYAPINPHFLFAK